MHQIFTMIVLLVAFLGIRCNFKTFLEGEEDCAKYPRSVTWWLTKFGSYIRYIHAVYKNWVWNTLVARHMWKYTHKKLARLWTILVARHMLKMHSSDVKRHIFTQVITDFTCKSNCNKYRYITKNPSKSLQISISEFSANPYIVLCIVRDVKYGIVSFWCVHMCVLLPKVL